MQELTGNKHIITIHKAQWQAFPPWHLLSPDPIQRPTVCPLYDTAPGYKNVGCPYRKPHQPLEKSVCSR